MKDYFCMTVLLWRVRLNPVKFLERVMFRTLTREAGDICFQAQVRIMRDVKVQGRRLL